MLVATRYRDRSRLDHSTAFHPDEVGIDTTAVEMRMQELGCGGQAQVQIRPHADLDAGAGHHEVQHVPAARVVTVEVVQMVPGDGDTWTADQLLAHRFASQLTREYKVDDDLYSEAEKYFGSATLVDLVGLYLRTCSLLNASRQPYRSM